MLHLSVHPMSHVEPEGPPNIKKRDSLCPSNVMWRNCRPTQCHMKNLWVHLMSQQKLWLTKCHVQNLWAYSMSYAEPVGPSNVRHRAQGPFCVTWSYHSWNKCFPSRRYSTSGRPNSTVTSTTVVSGVRASLHQSLWQEPGEYAQLLGIIFKTRATANKA